MRRGPVVERRRRPAAGRAGRRRPGSQELGIDVDVDFASMAAVANVFRVASAARGHLERTVLADAGLSFTAFTVMWVLWVWGESEFRDAGRRRRRHEGDADRRRRHARAARAGRPGGATPIDGRLVLVSATPAGEELMAGLFARFNDGERRIVAGLDDDEAEQLAHLLRKVLRTMEEIDDAAIRARSVVGAALVAHVPTIVLPEATRRELNEGQEISLVPGLHRMRAEQLDRLRPDTIVVFDAHWHTTVEFVVAAHARRAGLYTSEELPRGMCRMPYDFPGDPELAR